MQIKPTKPPSLLDSLLIRGETIGKLLVTCSKTVDYNSKLLLNNLLINITYKIT
jgi:hypothetical protein